MCSLLNMWYYVFCFACSSLGSSVEGFVWGLVGPMFLEMLFQLSVSSPSGVECSRITRHPKPFISQITNKFNHHRTTMGKMGVPFPLKWPPPLRIFGSPQTTPRWLLTPFTLLPTKLTIW